MHANPHVLEPGGAVDEQVRDLANVVADRGLLRDELRRDERIATDVVLPTAVHHVLDHVIPRRVIRGLVLRLDSVKRHEVHPVLPILYRRRDRVVGHAWGVIGEVESVAGYRAVAAPARAGQSPLVLQEPDDKGVLDSGVGGGGLERIDLDRDVGVGEVGDRRHDPVRAPSTAPQRPKEIRVLIRVRDHVFARGQHEGYLQHVVDT